MKAPKNDQERKAAIKEMLTSALASADNAKGLICVMMSESNIGIDAGSQGLECYVQCGGDLYALVHGALAVLDDLASKDGIPEEASDAIHDAVAELRRHLGFVSQKELHRA